MHLLGIIGGKRIGKYSGIIGWFLGINYFFLHRNPEIILIHHWNSASIKMVKRLMYSNRTVTYSNRTVTYSNRTVTCSNKTITYFIKRMIYSNRTILYLNRTATYPENSQPKVYISKIGFTCINILWYSIIMCKQV